MFDQQQQSNFAHLFHPSSLIILVVLVTVLTPAVKAVETLIQSGCEPSKIILGLPAYARHKTNPSQIKTYSELVDEWSKENSVDGDQTGFLALNEYRGYLLESRELIQKKVAMAMEKGLGGVFVWEIGQDYRNGSAFKEGMVMRIIQDAVDISSSAMVDHDVKIQDEL